jgi:hypothetical protein
LIVFGKYKMPFDGTVTLTANCEGKTYTKELPVKFGSERTDTFIPKLWATRCIEQLQMDLTLDNGADSEATMRSIIETSKRFRVMSHYTSFIVLETAEDYMRYGIERRPDEFSDDAGDFAVMDDLAESLDLGIAGANSLKDARVSDLKEGESFKRLETEKLGSLDEQSKADSDDGEVGLRKGGGRRLVVKRHGGSHADDKFTEQLSKKSFPPTDGKPMAAEKAAQDPRGGGALNNEERKANKYLKEVDTLAWARQDIFPDFQRVALPNWNDNWKHSSEKALEILKTLTARFNTLELTVTNFAVHDGKEVKQGRDWVVRFDRKTRAFLSKRIGEDYMDICDGKYVARLFPQLKYLARRSAVDEDLLAVGEVLPGFLAPWVQKLEHTHSISAEEVDGVTVLKLINRHDQYTYINLYLSKGTGPVTKIEYFQRRGNASQKVRTIHCEELKEINGLQIPTLIRVVQHNKDKDVVQSITRLGEISVNTELPADSFKVDVPADWAVRDLDAAPKNAEKSSISPPLDPSQNNNNAVRPRR